MSGFSLFSTLVRQAPSPKNQTPEMSEVGLQIGEGLERKANHRDLVECFRFPQYSSQRKLQPGQDRAVRNRPPLRFVVKPERDKPGRDDALEAPAAAPRLVAL